MIANAAGWVDYIEIPGTSYSDAAVRFSYRLPEMDNIWDAYEAIIQRLRLHVDAAPFSPRPDGIAPEDESQLYSLREGIVNMCEVLLERIGMSKSEFARQMGFRKQNVKALFKSKNLKTIFKAATVMNVPFEMLVGFIEEPELSDVPVTPYDEDPELSEEEIPRGDSAEDVIKRRGIISNFCREWKIQNPLQRRYNIFLKEYINIRFVSITERSILPRE